MSFSQIKTNTDSVLRYKTESEPRIQPPEVGTLIKDLCDATSEAIPQVKTSDINYVPAASGNVTDHGRFVRSAVNGRRYFIDLQGNAFDLDATSSVNTARKPMEIFTDAGITTSFTNVIPTDLMIIQRGGMNRYKNIDWILLSDYTIQ